MALTARVTGNAPAGTVQFKHGATTISQCGAVALNGSGQAVCANVSSLLQAGRNAFSAVYSGNAANLSSSGSTSVTLNKSASTTQLTTACLTTFTAGQPFSMTATASGYAPTGTVTFQTGATAITGCESVALDANSQVVCAIASWTAGSSLLAAHYAGDEFNAASASGSLMVDVLDPDDVLFRAFFDDMPAGCPAH